MRENVNTSREGFCCPRGSLTSLQNCHHSREGGNDGERCEPCFSLLTPKKSRRVDKNPAALCLETRCPKSLRFPTFAARHRHTGNTEPDNQ